MNYIEHLTQEEKLILCEIITGRDFKELFKKNSNDFSKIQKGGFRPKTLPDEKALSIAKDNIDAPFITKWVNTKVDTWLKEIQKKIEQLGKDDSNQDIALAEIMLDSVFASNADLYFKLAEKTLDMDSYSQLFARIESIKFERAVNLEVTRRIKAIEAEKDNLHNQIKTLKQSVTNIKAESEQKIQELKQQNAQSESFVNELQEEIAELQEAPANVINDNTNYLALFDDTNTSILPSVGSNETVSLCEVFTDYNGQKMLMRYADLNYNGRYFYFYKNKNSLPYFENRERIFYKDGPTEDGFYGVWTCSAVPNNKDPFKDYISSKYHTIIDAIEVITISEAADLDDLINLLKKGIKSQLHSRQVMLTICTSKN